MKLRLRAINRFFNLVLGALAMLVVALTSAFLSMRLAIHGREVKVPNLARLTIDDASKDLRALGLRLTLEDRFYSTTTPPGLILAQSPAPGATVRRQWAVRITESLGPQQVSIPNLLGQSERTAGIDLRQLQLELGTLAYIPSPAEPGTVLAQTPNPNASGVERPRVSLLLSQPEDSEDPAAAPAIVMPSLTGLPLMTAAARATEAGLRIISAAEIKPAAPPSPTTPASTAIVPTAGTSTATVVAQTPLAGYRVIKGDPIKLSIAY